jgi:carboxylesterase 2
MRTDFIYGLLCLAFTSHASPVVHARAPDPTVSLASGVVVGTATRVSNQPSVTGLASAYLGIPFASSPPLRFAPPTAPSPWKEPLVAQKLPPACLQAFGTGATAARTEEYFNTPPPPAGESEDCLYLNVYAPPDASPSNLKPVMFWIYGVSSAAHREADTTLTSTGQSRFWRLFFGYIQWQQPCSQRGCRGRHNKLQDQQ